MNHYKISIYLILLVASVSLSAQSSTAEAIDCSRWPGYQDCRKFYSYRFEYQGADGVCTCSRRVVIYGINASGGLEILNPDGGHPTWVTSLEDSNCSCDNMPSQQNDGDTQNSEIEEVVFQSQNLLVTQVGSPYVDPWGWNSMLYVINVYLAGGGVYPCISYTEPTYQAILDCIKEAESLGNN